MEQIIKQYLDELAEKDQLFKEKYNPDHLEWCIKYLYRQAKFIAVQTKQKNMIAMKSDTVFHWAREYFDEGTNLKEEAERLAKTKKEEELFPTNRDDFEDPMPDNSNLDTLIEENKRMAEELQRKREEEERYKREHKNGQITIFDLLGG